MQQSQWYPPSEVTDHLGKPLTEEMDYFATPSPEIGKIISANTTLKVSNKDSSPSLQWMFTLFGALITGIGLQYVLFLLEIQDNIYCQLGLITIVLGIGALIYAKVRFFHLCTYVGEQGIAEYKLSKSRSNSVKSRLFIFKDAENLFTSTIRQYYNGIYVGTNYLYRWKKGDRPHNKPSQPNIFILKGRHREKRSSLIEQNLWDFANAAELSWGNYRWKSMSNELDKFGYVEFPTSMKNPKFVRVGKGFMEFVLKDESTKRVDVSEMKNISLGNGLFKFVHQDANWWSGKGKYSFHYAKLPNPQLFLWCLDRLSGIRWS